jgi:hypothetical protein
MARVILRCTSFDIFARLDLNLSCDDLDAFAKR